MSNEIKFKIKNIVLQPTTFCNISCKYCYLAEKDDKKRMSDEITKKISKDIEDSERYVNILWHAGEPMSSGLNHFKELFNPFKNNKYVSNIIQTNATLINNEWCDFFKENNFHIGISIDGPQWANENRIDRKGRETYFKTIEGINILKSYNIKYTIISVVDFASIERAKELYIFFKELGCEELGINIEELECVNKREICDDERIQIFWEELFEEWYKDQSIEIREFNSTLNWFDELNRNENYNNIQYSLDLIPTISHNGDIVLLSPELLGGIEKKYNNFVIGNVLNQNIFKIEENYSNINYVKDFIRGVIECKNTCDYYSFCRGGQASNKYFEKGDISATETKFCRNSKIRVVNAVIKKLNFQ